jgi:cytochrome c553
MNKLTLSALFATSLVIAAPGHAADVAAGRAKADAAACSDCHGAKGKGDDDFPAIAGMTADKFTLAMNEFRDGKRAKNKKMVAAAKKLSPDDIANLAAYYASLPK